MPSLVKNPKLEAMIYLSLFPGPLAPYAMFQTPHAAKTDMLSERNKCYDPNSCKDHYCLIITPESAHVIILIVIRQTDKHPNYGYPIY